MSSSYKHIYLDAAASASNAEFTIQDNFANPNSVHKSGRKAFEVLESARNTMVSIIGAKRPSEIIFTSGATEANNMAIFGIARAVRNQQVNSFKTYIDGFATTKNTNTKLKVLVSAIEHESALIPAVELKKEGFEVEIIPVDRDGYIDMDVYKKKLTPNTILVVVQHANTEVGVLQNIQKLVDLAHEVGAYFHSDMVGSFGRIPINVHKFSVDSASFSGHKIGAPKGIGMLYLKTKTPCKPLIFGGGQENGMRGGTQSVALAEAMSKAIQKSTKNMDEQTRFFVKLKKYIVEQVSQLPNVCVTAPEAQLSNIIHLGFVNMDSEDLILHYGKHNIDVSGGTACSSADKKPSYVLRAMKVGKDEIYGALRLSFNSETTFEDIETFIDTTKDICRI